MLQQSGDAPRPQGGAGGSWWTADQWGCREGRRVFLEVQTRQSLCRGHTEHKTDQENRGRGSTKAVTVFKINFCSPDAKVPKLSLCNKDCSKPVDSPTSWSLGVFCPTIVSFVYPSAKHQRYDPEKGSKCWKKNDLRYLQLVGHALFCIKHRFVQTYHFNIKRVIAS